MNVKKRWAQMMAGRVVLLDCETTGLYPDSGDRIVSIALVCIDNGAVTHTWSTLVNPGRDSGAVHIHGLTTEMLSAAPRFEAVASTIHETIAAARAVGAHNASFDLRFLTVELASVGLAVPPVLVLDTRTLAGALDVPAASERLADVAAAYGVQIGVAHRADQDAAATAQLLIAQLWRGVNDLGWADLAQVAQAPPVSRPLGSSPDAVPAPRPRRKGAGLVFDLLDFGGEDMEARLAEHRDRDAARAAARSQQQQDLWERFEAETGVMLTPAAVAKSSPVLVADAALLWPDGHPDRIEILDKLAGWCHARLEKARTPTSRAKAALSLLDIYEAGWAQHLAAGTCRAQVHTYGWPEALVAVPPETGLACYRQWAPVLDRWVPCADCADCRDKSTSYTLGCAITGCLFPLDEAQLGTDDVLGRDQGANAWAQAFTSAHDIAGLSFLTSRRLKSLESAGLDTQAAAAGQEALDAGAVDLFVANRLAIVYERKLADPAAALAVSLLALTWPRRDVSPFTYDTIAKRAARLAKKV